MTRSSNFKLALTYAGVALLAGSLSLALWFAGFLAPFQHAFVLLPNSDGSAVWFPSLGMSALLILAGSLAAATAVGHFGARRSFPSLGGGFLALAILSLVESRFFSIDILFAPIALAASLSAVTMQIKRLRDNDTELTKKLIASSRNLESLQADNAGQQLMSGLKLLDIVLAPTEAVLFRRDTDGRLVSSARLRPAQGNLETGQNSAWRDGVRLCEKSMSEGEIMVMSLGPPDSSTRIALPLRHEDRTVGALLIRVTREFDDDDRALLGAIGGQLARNLQREEANKATHKRSLVDFFSARGSQRKLEALYALNGAFLEQSVGVNALSEITDGVALGYLDGRIACVNKSLLALSGLSLDQALDLSFFDLLDRFRTDVFDEPALAVRRVLQTGDAYERELQFREHNETYGLRISLVEDSSGVSKPESSRASNQMKGSSQPLCLALIIKDVTRIKEYEQLKSDMISLMSHELRTPLTSINGFAELLTADEELPEQAKEFVTIIANESQRLSRMINTFLAVTDLQRSDRREFLKIPLRLDEVVKETIANLQPAAKKRRIRLVEQPTQRLPPVAADKSMITQAVKNLVTNAIKYSPERTTVTVSTALEAETVRLSVEDRGYGIPAEARDRVWEKFYRVVREGQEKDEDSTGLGLSFVREVVEQHGGSVDLESEVGRGSKFSFTLPRL